MEWLKIATSSELVRIAADEIVYILADGNYCDIMLASGSTHKMTFQLHYFEDYLTRLGLEAYLNNSIETCGSGTVSYI